MHGAERYCYAMTALNCNYALNVITLRYTELQIITLHYIVLNCTKLHHTALDWIVCFYLCSLAVSPCQGQQPDLQCCKAKVGTKAAQADFGTTKTAKLGMTDFPHGFLVVLGIKI